MIITIEASGKLWMPVYERDGNEFVVQHNRLRSSALTKEGAREIEASMRSDTDRMGLTFVEVREFDVDDELFYKETFFSESPIGLGLIGGPLFDMAEAHADL